MHSLPKLRKWYNQFTSSTPLSDNEIAGKYLLSVNFAFVFMTGFLSTSYPRAINLASKKPEALGSAGPRTP
jgi:hypothetical protein